MTQQRKYKTYAPSRFWPDGASARSLPKGVVDQNAARREGALTQPSPANATLLARGRERLEIFCAPCHGLAGDGDGIVVQRGFPAPPSYHSDELVASPAQELYPYAARVEPADRWAIVANIRALQMTRPPGLAAAVAEGATSVSLDLAPKVDVSSDDAARLHEPPDWRLSSWLLAGAIVAYAGFGALLAFWPRAAAGGFPGRRRRRHRRRVRPGNPCYDGRPLAILALSFIPVLVLLSSFYPWVEEASLPPADVRSLYLNPPFFALRGIVALVFWSLAGIFLPRLAGGQKTLAGAVALVFHVFIIGLIGADWVVSLQPGSGRVPLARHWPLRNSRQRSPGP